MRTGLSHILIIIFLLVVAFIFIRYYKRVGTDGLDIILSPQDYINAGSNVIMPKESDQKVITWIVYSYLPNVRAGSEMTLQDLNVNLIEKGWKVYILVVKWCQPNYKGIPLIPIEKERELVSPYVKRLLERSSIIGCQNYPLDTAIEAAAVVGRPVLYYLHTNETHPYMYHKGPVPLYLIHNADSTRVLKQASWPSATVRPIVRVSEYEIVKKPEEVKYITLVNCNINKGGDLLPKLAAAMPGHQFLGVRGAYRKQVVSENKSLPNLKYLPTQDNMRSIYAQTRILIMPSDAETWGRTAIEAMASGTPVIGSKATGLQECMGNAGMTCAREDVSCWIEAIKSLDDPKLYAEWSEKARIRAIQLDREIQEDFERLDAFLDKIREDNVKPESVKPS